MILALTDILYCQQSVSCNFRRKSGDKILEVLMTRISRLLLVLEFDANF